jgi:hypothetical protein
VIELEPLRQAIAERRAVLFTGAGFSSEARDTEGAPLPVASVMAEELRALCFRDCPEDDSTLQDLYDVATEHHPDALLGYLRRRLRVGAHPLPEHYRRWFAAPWARIYTLNVDDLEDAAARQFGLTGLPEVVHLNGRVGDDLDAMTFSTLQHAQRLVTPCPLYTRLIDDLERRPFLFVGTVLDETLFWQHLQLRRSQRGDRPRPRSYLVTPHLSRARRELLSGLSIDWVEGTAGELADRMFSGTGSR